MDQSIFLKHLLKYNEPASYIASSSKSLQTLKFYCFNFMDHKRSVVHLDILYRSQQVVLCEMASHFQQQNPHID